MSDKAQAMINQLVTACIEFGRKGIGLDLNLTYLYENAKDRIEAEMLPLLTLIEQE